MRHIPKVPATSGAQWLLDSFFLLRRAPLFVTGVIAIWSFLNVLIQAISAIAPQLGLPLQIFLFLANPVFLAGLLWTLSKIDQGHTPKATDMLHGLQSGRLAHLLLTLLPVVLIVIILSLLLIFLIGPAQLPQLLSTLEEFATLAKSNPNIDPAQAQALIATLPAARLLLWLLLALCGAIAVAFILFVAIPQIIFEQRNGLLAMRDSLRACLHNLPAIIVLTITSFIFIFIVALFLNILAMVLQQLIGLAGILIVQFVFTLIIKSLSTTVAYVAWKQLFLSPTSNTPITPNILEA